MIFELGQSCIEPWHVSLFSLPVVFEAVEGFRFISFARTLPSSATLVSTLKYVKTVSSKTPHAAPAFRLQFLSRPDSE